MSEVFDGLATIYNQQRPRYPRAVYALLEQLVDPTPPLNILDAGSGPGVVLEDLLPTFGPLAHYTAVDISADMVATGAERLPEAIWVHSPVEPDLEQRRDLALITVGQAAHWFDRPRFYAAAIQALRPGGVLAIIQNNRDYTRGGFAQAWEELAEAYSPGYTRTYRDFPYAQELAEAFAPADSDHGVYQAEWTLTRSPEDTRGRALSSSKMQAALAAAGDTFEAALDAAIAANTEDGQVSHTMITEVYWVRTAIEA